MSLNINDCTDVLDLVMLANEDVENVMESAIDEEVEDTYGEVDDDVYDAAMEDLYGDGISIGDLDAEEMSCSTCDVVDGELEDDIYDDMVKGCCEDDDYEDDEDGEDYECDDSECYDDCLPESDDPYDCE